MKSARQSDREPHEMKNNGAPELLIGACVRCGGSAKYDSHEGAYRCMMCARQVLPVAFSIELPEQAAPVAA